MNDSFYETMHILKAIDQLELDDWFLSFPKQKSYTFIKHENIQKILNHKLVYNDCHTNSSFGIALKHAHSIINNSI